MLLMHTCYRCQVAGTQRIVPKVQKTWKKGTLEKCQYPGGWRIYFSIQTGNRQTEGTREKEQPPRGVAEIFLRTQNKNSLQKTSSEQQRKNEEDEKPT